MYSHTESKKPNTIKIDRKSSFCHHPDTSKRLFDSRTRPRVDVVNGVWQIALSTLAIVYQTRRWRYRKQCIGERCFLGATPTSRSINIKEDFRLLRFSVGPIRKKYRSTEMVPVGHFENVQIAATLTGISPKKSHKIKRVFSCSIRLPWYACGRKRYLYVFIFPYGRKSNGFGLTN